MHVVILQKRMQTEVWASKTKKDAAILAGFVAKAECDISKRGVMAEFEKCMEQTGEWFGPGDMKILVVKVNEAWKKRTTK